LSSSLPRERDYVVILRTRQCELLVGPGLHVIVETPPLSRAQQLVELCARQRRVVKALARVKLRKVPRVVFELLRNAVPPQTQTTRGIALQIGIRLLQHLEI